MISTHKRFLIGKSRTYVRIKSEVGLTNRERIKVKFRYPAKQIRCIFGLMTFKKNGF